VKVPVKLGLFALVLLGTFAAGAAVGAAVPEIGNEGGRVTTEQHTDGRGQPSHVTEEP